MVACAPSPRAFEHIETAEVHRSRDLRRVARTCGDLDAGRDADSYRRRAERRGEAARLESRRVDPVRKERRLVKCLLHVAPHLLEERLRRRGIGVRQLPRELQVYCEGDEVLLNALVQGALDPEAIGVGREDESLPGRADLRDLDAQPVERFL